jgi:hypothetical protein
MLNHKNHTVPSGTEKTKGGDSTCGVSRRRFLLYVTVGGAWLTVGHIVRHRPEKTPTSDEYASRMPKLREDVTMQYDNIQHVYECEVQGKDGNATCCTVNDTGAEIIRLLNGKRTVEDLSEQTASSGHWRDSNASRAEIAYFITQLGILGFLAKPFYAHICEIYTYANA